MAGIEKKKTFIVQFLENFNSCLQKVEKWVCKLQPRLASLAQTLGKKSDT